jgi:DNA recombination protein RmuC
MYDILAMIRFNLQVESFGGYSEKNGCHPEALPVIFRHKITYMNIVFLMIGLVTGGILGWLAGKLNHSVSGSSGGEAEELRMKHMDVVTENSALKQAGSMLQKDNELLRTEVKAQQQQLITLHNQLTASTAKTTWQEEKLAEQKSELARLQETFSKEFENLANRIFEEKSRRFADQNKVSLDQLLKPLGEKIKDFESKVQQSYEQENRDKASLRKEIEMLYSLNQQMTKDAQNLTKALKGETKTQGNWGEMILESILEKSGLVKNREYSLQASLTTEEGKRFQPDVVINLPDAKHIIIDSKVSLNAYERFSSAETEEERNLAIREHLVSLRKHIRELGDKNYQSLYQIRSLDFVLLFVPVEPAFALAVQYDTHLFNEAFEKNIVIVSPSTTLATLRTIASIWKQENQNRNALEIARQGGALYDKVAGFVEDMLTLGTKMRDSQKAYDGAMNKLSKGTGNLLKRTEDLKRLGLKTTKNLPPDIIENE